MNDLIEIEDEATRAFVLYPDMGRSAARELAQSALAEAVALTEALPGLEITGSLVVRLVKPTPGTLFGKGKMVELGDIFKQAEVDLVLVDGTVSPVQQRNMEEAWGVKILDRTGLILEIFSDRARTREGVLQVEMAALSYQRTRLVRAWTHLERQRGGLGFVGGPGETQIEADRRAIDDQLVRIRRQLGKVSKTRDLHRRARAKVPYPIIALVGYTNAGKSTLFNRLTGADVFVKDMLFATLDPTMRQIDLPSGRKAILSDTVGFISDLPTELVAAFRATLEEVLEADLICHVRDISHADTVAQARNVEKILSDLGVDDSIDRMEVWNKVDLLDADTRDARQIEADRNPDTFAISALTGAGLDTLLDAYEAALLDPQTTDKIIVAFADGRKRGWLFEKNVIDAEDAKEDGWHLTVTWTARQAAEYNAL